MRNYLIHHLIENTGVQYSNKIAVKHGERAITYQQLMEESTRMGALIKSLKINRGERVGVLLDKSIEQVVSFFGISMSEGVSVFINPILKKEQMEHIIRDCDANLLI